MASIEPITPVPLVGAALLSFGETVVRRSDLLERLDDYRDHLRDARAKLVREERGVEAILAGAGHASRARTG